MKLEELNNFVAALKATIDEVDIDTDIEILRYITVNEMYDNLQGRLETALASLEEAKKQFRAARKALPYNQQISQMIWETEKENCG